MSISYCVTCRDRLDHLIQTVPVSLSQIANDDEIVILDYGSSDGVSEVIQRVFSSLIKKGIIRYGRVEAEEWNIGHAKNIAHKLGTKPILCNIDADNYVTKGFSQWIEACFKVYSDSITCVDFNGYGGGCGRIALSRDNFLKIGGYREDLNGWGYDDFDLVNRAKVIGLRPIVTPVRFLNYIRHSDSMRQILPGTGKEENNHINKVKSENAIRLGQWRANGPVWGEARVSVNFEGQMLLV